MNTFTAIACLFAIAATLSFANDRYLRLQHDIGLLLLAGLTTACLRILEVFVPSGAIGLLHQLTQSFNLNDTLLKGGRPLLLTFSGQYARQLGSATRATVAGTLVGVCRHCDSMSSYRRIGLWGAFVFRRGGYACPVASIRGVDSGYRSGGRVGDPVQNRPAQEPGDGGRRGIPAE